MVLLHDWSDASFVARLTRLRVVLHRDTSIVSVRSARSASLYEANLSLLRYLELSYKARLARWSPSRVVSQPADATISRVQFWNYLPYCFVKIHLDQYTVRGFVTEHIIYFATEIKLQYSDNLYGITFIFYCFFFT